MAVKSNDVLGHAEIQAPAPDISGNASATRMPDDIKALAVKIFAAALAMPNRLDPSFLAEQSIKQSLIFQETWEKMTKAQ